MTSGERPLAGGHLGPVVRVGDSVRRPSGPWTPAVHALLAHLEARGFDAAPRARGLDEQGREILTFVPGEAVGAARPLPAWCFGEETLRALGALLREYHAAVADFEPPPGARWRLTDRRAGPGEVVCHNDVAPRNLVRRPDGRLCLIDWDVAGPASPLDDLAFAACAFVPLLPDADCLALGFRALSERPRRLRRLVDCYGLADRGGLVDRLLDRLAASASRIRQAASAGDPAFGRLAASGVLERLGGQRAWIEQRRGELEDVLEAAS